jgi:hypothetical protein
VDQPDVIDAIRAEARLGSAEKILRQIDAGEISVPGTPEREEVATGAATEIKKRFSTGRGDQTDDLSNIRGGLGIIPVPIE